MTESQKSKLIQLASEMMMGKDMPLEFIEDWNLPKTTPRSAKAAIIAAAELANRQANHWGNRIAKIVNESKVGRVG